MTCAAALLLIDVVNPFDFDGADALHRHAVSAARAIAGLAERAREVNVPTIYVNDNFDKWHLGFPELLDLIRREHPRGREVIDLLAPEPARDHYILKPMHSGFFATGLEVLLARLGIRTLVLTGVAADICVLFTANDAYMRGFEVVVPADCVASERPDDCARALAQMERLLKADVRPSTELDLARLAGRCDPSDHAA
jgi:nicotinamidase-related amidase